MSTTTDRLTAARDKAWRDLKPAFDHAIAVALECEYQADQASNMVLAAIQPAYPPLVRMLAESVDAPDPYWVAELRDDDDE